YMENKNQKINRRNFLGDITKISLLGILPYSAISKRNLALKSPKIDNGNTIIAGPYLQSVQTDEVTIMWITAKDAYSWVEYGDNHSLDKKAFTIKDGLKQANNRINQITLKNLNPDTSYKYRILSTVILDFEAYNVDFGNTVKSDTYRFRTAAKSDDKIRWVVMNDIHDHPQTIPEMLHQFGSKGNKPDYDFVVFNGDSFSWVHDEKQIIEHLLTPCKNVFAKEIPFYLNR